MKFNSFIVGTGSNTLVGGVQPASGDNIAATAFAIQLEAGGPANFTVNYIGSPYTTFDLKGLSYSCAAATMATVAFVTVKCRLRFTAYDANKYALGSREVTYIPDGTLALGRSSQSSVTFGDEWPKFKGVVTVGVEVAASTLAEKLLEPLIGIALDSIGVVYHA